MTKETAIIRFRAAMTVFKRWLAEGIMTEKELAHISTIIARKYGLPSESIYN